MSSSWFTNIISVSKKKPDRISVVEASETTVTEEGFTIIQSQRPYPPASMYPVVPPPLSSEQPLPYAILNNSATNQTYSPTHIGKPHHQLDSIPFMLNQKLEMSMSSQGFLPDVENIRRSIVQLTADISDSWFDYDFKVERNVLKEMCHHNET